MLYVAYSSPVWVIRGALRQKVTHTKLEQTLVPDLDVRRIIGT